MAYIEVKNKSLTTQVLINANGDKVYIESGQILRVSEEYLYSYDPTAIVRPDGLPLAGTPSGDPNGPLTYPTFIPPYSVICTQGQPNILTYVTVGENQLIGRINNGDIESIPLTTISAMTSGSWVLKTGETWSDSILPMMLVDLAPLVPDPINTIVFIGSELLDRTSEYTIVGSRIFATSVLNIRYGGFSSDGNGLKTLEGNPFPVTVVFIPAA